MAIRIGLVAAMPAEARSLAGRKGWAAKSGFAVKTLDMGTVQLVFAHSGVGRDKARQAALLLLEDKVHALGSLGIAGGLAPGALPGHLLAAAWIDPHGPEPDSLPTHEHLARNLAQDLARSGLPAHLGGLACLDAQATTVEEKARLHGLAGALACDMESLGPALAAREAGVPFFALKAVSDPAGRSLPPAALRGMDDQGRSQALPVLVHLARNPGQLPALVRLALDFNAALKALARAAPVMAASIARTLPKNP